MTALETPPLGARVRHTTTYTDGTVSTVEGTVARITQRGAIIGAHEDTAYVCTLEDKSGVFTVALEVLELPRPPLPSEPADHVHMVCNGYVFTRRDDTAKARYPLELERRWFDGSPEGMTWPEVLAYGEAYSCPLVRLIPDPADTAPALPWDVEDKDGDRLEIDTIDMEGVAAAVSVDGIWAYLSPAVAREAAGVLLRAAREFEEREAGQS